MLVDTNVLSELPRPRPNAQVLRWFAGQKTVQLSVVTLEELAFGVSRASLASRDGSTHCWRARRSSSTSRPRLPVLPGSSGRLAKHAAAASLRPTC
jgi:predicted nucleic acid-binding protein